MEKSKLKIEAPTWDLTDFYESPNDPKIEEDFKILSKKIESFCKKYEANIHKLQGDGLYQAIKDYESISESISFITSYAVLVYTQNMNDKKGASFYQHALEKAADLSKKLIFFCLEINQIPDKSLNQFYKESAELKFYKPWIDDTRVFKPHQLDQKTETLFHELSLPASNNWVRLYDETFASLKFSFQGKEYSCTEILNFSFEADKNLRKESSLVFGEKLKEISRQSSLILNTLAKEKQISDTWHHYDRPVASRNRENHVEDKVIETLLKSVQNNYQKTSHRFYKLKAKWLGQEKLNYWDRNAPLPTQKMQTYSWDEARDIVLEAYHQFSPEMAKIGKQFFDNSWIDAALRPGKDGGAFSHATVPSVHPYILQNYQGKVWDIMTLAHELGHGIHQVLSAKQGYLMADTPLTLAETASIFGEMLTFQSLLSKTQNKEERKTILAGKVSDMLNSIVRQISFSLFEHKFHDIRRDHELTTEEICDIWMETQKESLGPYVELSGNYAYYWSYISHFFHVPFYVYAYAFGNCLVNSLYMRFQESPKGFQDKYISMLSAGGTLHHKDLLKPFNLDATKSNFWDQGLDLVSTMIDELEDLS